MPSAQIDVGPMLDTHIGFSTIGFIKMSSGIPEPLGSGTLVKIRTVQGILTCGHVSEEVAKETEIGIALFPIRKGDLQKLVIPIIDLIPKAICWDDHLGQPGRDLAFLPVPEEYMAGLGAKGSILDLDLQAERAGNPHPANVLSVEAAAGVVAELIPPASQRENRIVLSVEGLINVGQFISTSLGTGGLDLITLEPRPGSQLTLPTSYAA